MNKIIFNQIQRLWLPLAIFCLMSVSAGLTLGTTRVISISGGIVPAICMAVIGCLGQSLRVLLSLPLTARQIGRATWWLSVPAPTLLYAVFSAIGILLLSLARTHGQFLGTWFQMYIATGPGETRGQFPGIWLESVVVGGLLCGSIFCLISCAIIADRSRAREPRHDRFLWKLYDWAFAIALIAGIVGGIWFLCNGPVSITARLVILCLLGFAFSVVGWFSAESMFVDHRGSRRDVAGAGITRGKFEPRPGYGGMAYLMTYFCFFYLIVAAFMIAVVIGFGNIIVWWNHRGRWSDPDWVLPALIEFQFWLFILYFLQTLIVGAHLKFLRSLPLTSRQLTAVILCLAIVPVLIIGGSWILFVLIEPGILPASALLKFCLLNLAPACVLTTGVIWYNDQFRRIAGIILAWILSIVPIIYQLAIANRYVGSHSLPIWIIIALPIVSLFFALFAIRRLLERNEMAYRIKFGMLGNPEFFLVGRS